MTQPIPPILSAATRVVVVEDEPLSRDMLVRRLTSRGFEVVDFSDAAEAIQYIDQERVDLLLIDNAMPTLSGVDAIRLLRQKWSADALPIIVVSAMVDSDDVVEALEAGANDYVVKPVNFKVLMARLRTALRMKATVGQLVEAERQRVMMESLARAAATVAEPLGRMVDELERLMHPSPGTGAGEASDESSHDASHEASHNASHDAARFAPLMRTTEQAVDVIDKLRAIASMRGVPYDTRLDYLTEPGA